MFEYQTLFDARGALYSLANRMFPEARAEEARQLFSQLDLAADAGWLDISAGGGYLSARALEEGLPPARASCDGSFVFLSTSSRLERASVARAEALPFADGAFSGAACLAALHHSEEPERLVAELLRVTRRGGRAAIGDVVAESAAARFLNGFVDRHTEQGHRGRFFHPAQLAGFFAAAGGSQVRSCRVEVPWVFAKQAEALLFARQLFGLAPDVSDAELAEALRWLGAPVEEGPVRIAWSMAFASAEGTGDRKVTRIV